MEEYILSKAEEDEVIAAIVAAEKLTSGEIRVHIDKASEGDAIERVKSIFTSLNMHKTKERNGVLFHVVVKQQLFTIWGDQGIHEKVPEGFWQSTTDKVIAHFKDKAFKKGLLQGISEAGIQLAKYFPIQPDDTNELPNTISYD